MDFDFFNSPGNYQLIRILTPLPWERGRGEADLIKRVGISVKNPLI
jgi:hypothetical protein